MARNRQRAKQRQAERRAREGEPRPGQPRASEPPVTDPRASEPAPGIDPNLAVGAPPQDEGRSDTVVADEPILDDDDHLTEEEVLEELDEEQDDGYAPRGRRGAEARERKHRSRVVQFLIASWAELQRVQWPNRQALTTLTGVVLGFVLIAGGYLGLLDAIVSRIIKAIL
jgi:preprotein translocase subunit SecE